MSTKTTFKRIALVTVAALGFSLLSVAPGSATISGTSATGSVDVTLGTASAVNAITGNEARITVPYTITALAANGDTVTVGMNLVTAPSTSAATNANSSTAGWSSQASSAAIVDGGDADFTKSAGVAGGLGATGAAVRWAVTDTITAAGNVNTAATNVTVNTRFFFTPDKAGTYLFSYFIDVDNSGTATSGDDIKYFSLVVADAPATLAVTSKLIDADYATYSTTVGTTAGVWLAVCIRDAAGNASNLASGQAALLTIPTGLTLVSVNSTAVSITAADYAMTRSEFIGANVGTGCAFVNVRASSAGTYNFTSKLVGGAESTVALKFVAPTGYTSLQVTGFLNAVGTAVAQTPIGNVGSSLWSSGTAATVPASSTSHTIRFNAAAAEAVLPVRVSDTTDNPFLGAGTRSMDLAVTASDTASLGTATNGSASLFNASVAIPQTLSINGDFSYKSFKFNSWTAAATAGSEVTVTGAARSATTGATLSLITPASTILVAPGATVTATVRCRDNFLTGRANVVLTPTIAGRNALTSVASIITDATGHATLTYTDASTSTTSLQDTITFSGCTTATTLLTVNYTSTANLGVNTLAWSAGGGYNDLLGTTVYYKGYTTTAISAGDDPSTGGFTTLTFKVTDANGTPIVGVPVTFALSGIANAAIVRTATVDYKTVYTGSTGLAATRVFAWAPGESVVTATAGGKTATGYITWTGAAESAARILTGSFKDNVLSYKVVDRYGNGVEGVDIALSRTAGSGFFATGSTTATAVTAADGTVEIQFNGSATVKATLPIGTYPQAWDDAGKIAATAVTAASTTAGVTTGTGASLAPKGVNTVELTVASTSVAEASATAAADAAAEATDAANAATDAANAAAEAADAATAAAQDAADAVAALSTQVTELVSALRKQITSLTNLVIKIQRKVRA
jgi:trimeric autotransporter adhesin